MHGSILLFHISLGTTCCPKADFVHCLSSSIYSSCVHYVRGLKISSNITAKGRTEENFVATVELNVTKILSIHVELFRLGTWLSRYLDGCVKINNFSKSLPRHTLSVYAQQGEIKGKTLGNKAFSSMAYVETEKWNERKHGYSYGVN